MEESYMQQVNSHDDELEQEFYIKECTWMRKHGWRIPECKLIIALEPDFHFKPEMELYNLKDEHGQYLKTKDGSLVNQEKGRDRYGLSNL